MTNQEAFDKVWKYFIVDRGKPGFDNDSNLCRYRSPDGGRCAAGVLIPDDKYAPHIEECGVERLVLYSVLPQVSVALVGEMQDLHDSLAPLSFPHEEFISEFAVGMRSIAKKFNIKQPEKVFFR